MNDALIAAMPGESMPAARLAAAMKTQMHNLSVHHFPDGESRVRAPVASKTTIVYCSLDRPNEKLVELGLAASALRDLGAQRLVLAAPYLCYMRQDRAFEPGEAVSQRVVGKMLSDWFDRVATIEPHLHRIRSLDDIFPGAETSALSAAPLLAQLIRSDGVDNPLVVGPDLESRNWAESVASDIGAPCTVLEKTRSGDRAVSVRLSGDTIIAGKHVYLVDDVASTGETLAAAARLLASAGAKRIEALIVHALFDDASYENMRDAGISRIQSTDSVRHATNAICVSNILADALSMELGR